MERRLFLSALTATLATLALPASAAPETDTSPATGWVTMTGVGLPVIVDGRVINHIFVELKLYLKPGYPPEQVRTRDANMRDALVREGHVRPFVVATDHNRINEGLLSRAVMQIAARQLGTGIVTRVEIVRQTPRMRVRNPTPLRR